MLDALAVPEPAARGERLFDLRVRVENPLTSEELHRVEKVACRADGRVDVEPVLHAREEVIGAVTRGCVDRAGALLEGHIVAEHGQRVALVERVPEYKTLHDRARELYERRPELAPGHAGDALGQRFGDDYDRLVYRIRRVDVLRMKRDREVRRNRPRGRRPDEYRHVAACQLRQSLGERSGTGR